MFKGLVIFVFVLAVAGVATRADCDGMSEAQCERANQMVDGMIG